MDNLESINVNALMETFGSLIVEYSLDVVLAIVLLIAGWWAAAWAARAVRAGLNKSKRIDETIVGVLSSIVRYAVLALVLVAVLAQFGVQTASILAVLGAAGLAIGLALQGTLSNIAAGLMLLFLRPFRNGDYVEIAGTGGTVIEIGLFTTELKTADGIYISLPNSNIWGSQITNYSRYKTRRLDIPVGIAYGDDIEAAKKALLELARGEERVLKDPEPEVMVTQLADSSVNLNLRCWSSTNDFWALKWQLNQEVKRVVEEAGCSIPFPQRELHVIGSNAVSSS